MERVSGHLQDALGALRAQDYSSAEKAYADAVKAAVCSFGENDVLTARALGHLSRVCAAQEKRDLAISLYERLLKIHRALPEPVSTDHVTALQELAGLYDSVGTSQDAAKLREEASGVLAEVKKRLDAAERRREEERALETDSSDQSDGSSEGEGDSTTSSQSGRSQASERNKSKDLGRDVPTATGAGAGLPRLHKQPQGPTK